MRSVLPLLRDRTSCTHRGTGTDVHEQNLIVILDLDVNAVRGDRFQLLSYSSLPVAL
jgi:hypothetical protein